MIELPLIVPPASDTTRVYEEGRHPRHHAGSVPGQPVRSASAGRPKPGSSDGAPRRTRDQAKLEGMGKLSRTDWIIGAAILAVLLALLGFGLAQRSSSSPTAAATAPGTGQGRTSPSTQPGASRTTAAASTTGAPTTTAAPTTTVGAPTTTSGVAAVGPITPPVAGSVSAVGDSIMLDIQPDLEADIPGARVDGLVSRQFETGIGVVQAERAAGTLGNVLIVELGTNGSVTSSDFDAMMQAAAGVQRVVFVNVNVPRSWEATDNQVLAAGVARYPGVAVLADWNALSTPHPEWFTPDQVHLEPAGAAALAGLVAHDA